MHRLLILLGAGLATTPQTTFDSLAKRFENDPNQPHEVRSAAIQGSAGVRQFDYSFASPVAGRVPGTLVTPARSGRFPIILFGHWMMNGSPLKNRNEFHEEAIVLARAGAICLLLDTPLVRPGVVDDPELLHGQEPNASLQMAREWRRALDILLRRSDVDSGHVAYVGHSFSAGVGAKLIAVEKRIQSFVLIANVYSLREWVYDEKNEEMASWRKKVGEPVVEAYFARFPWEDSVEFAKRSAPSAVFLQNGRLDKEIPERSVRKSFEYFQQPKQVEFYDAGHELNSSARADRAKWLQRRLNLKNVDLAALDSIPQLR